MLAKSLFFRIASFFSLFFFSLLLSHCGTTANEQQLFTCESGRDGWQQCKDNKIQYCHVEGSSPHFHWGQDCAGQGLRCVANAEAKRAACVDESKPCQGSEARCEGNTALTCTDGFFAMLPCGTARLCEEKDGKASCVRRDGEKDCGGFGEIHEGKCECVEGYQLDPADDKKCVKKD